MLCSLSSLLEAIPRRQRWRAAADPSTRAMGCIRAAIRAAGVTVGGVAGDDARVLELAGREVRITSPGKVLFGERGETKLDLVRYYAAVAEPLMRAMGGRPVLMQRFPQGAGGPSFFQKRVPASAPEWLRDDDRRRPSTARRRERSWRPTSRTSPGRSTSPASASTSGRTAPTTPSTPTSCAWTSTRSRAPASPRRARPRGSSRRCWTSSGSPASPRRPATAGCTSTSGSQPRWDSYAVRSAAVAAARELERRRPDILTAAWWKEERGRADLRRLQPERAAQDRVRRVVGPRPPGRAGLDAGPLGGARRGRPRRADAGERARTGSSATATRGPRSTTPRSRSSRCSRCTSATARTACSTRRGRPSTPSSPTSRRASRRAARGARPDGRPAVGLRGRALQRRSGGRDLAHAVLLHLARDRHREVVDELPVARDLERRDPAAAGRRQVLARSAPRRRAA